MNIVYDDAAVMPMDLAKIAQKTDNFEYRCCEEFLADVKWIIHNNKARFTRKFQIKHSVEPKIVSNVLFLDLLEQEPKIRCQFNFRRIRRSQAHQIYAEIHT